MNYLTTIFSFDTLALLATLFCLVILFIRDFKSQLMPDYSDPLCVKRSLAFQKVSKRNF